MKGRVQRVSGVSKIIAGTMWSIAAVCLVWCLGLMDAQAAEGKSLIRVKGGDEMAGRIDALSKEFLQARGDCSVLVTGGTTGDDFPDLLNRNCEVLMLGHSLSPDDKKAARAKGVELEERVLGYGALVVITYLENPVQELSVDQIKMMMRGDMKNWQNVGGHNVPVVVVGVAEPENDSRLFVLRDFLSIPQVRCSVERVSCFPSVLGKVAATRGAMGYCRLRDIKGDAKVLKIKKDANSPAIMPTRDTCSDGTYPIRHPLMLCYDSNAKPVVKEFVDFLSSHKWEN